MIARLLALCLVVASAATLVYIVTLALTPNPNAPERPRTWPTTHIDAPLTPPPSAAASGAA